MNNEMLFESAKQEMNHAFSKLPIDYFDHKDASTHLFNNIVRLYDRKEAYSLETSGHTSILSNSIDKASSIGFYAGVPWCAMLCSFCDLAYSVSTDTNVRRKYIEQLLCEIDLLMDLGAARKNVTSVYFGGGTPTVLDEEMFDQYLSSVIGKFRLADKSSISCEASVGTLTHNKMDIMKRNGVTRLSMGVQSLDNAIRKAANMPLSGDEALAVVKSSLGEFEMINVDLLYGYPEQSNESWLDTVSRVASSGVPSITLYRLEVRERTVNKKAFIKNRELFGDEMNARWKYFIGKKVLTEYGYTETPLGWWIKSQGNRSVPSWEQHMRNWTTVTPYIGVGQGAFSQSLDFYYQNSKDLKKWSGSIEDGQLPITTFKALDEKDAFIFRFCRVLRTMQQFNRKLIETEIQASGLERPFNTFLSNNIQWGMLEQSDEASDVFALTDGGKALIHWIIDDFIVSMSDSERVPQTV
ncbi:coproporphyrinogen-III oxidase family protein [Paenibacillus kobensis]|uniref:coproporphyrinogen-III oxidase family protein n=1 Tax=Paenibacillus kobensis TaxID=59841 RepID=UPI000FD8F152|nr:radical SAM protein [Paenibacillus kobensis]